MIKAWIAVGVECLVRFSMVLMHRADGVAVGNSAAGADAIEREIHIALPVGSSLSAVEDVLSRRGIEFSFDKSSKTVNAIVRKLRGSTSVVTTSLALHFNLDDGSKLKSF
jgi:hypothetical protein